MSAVADHAIAVPWPEDPYGAVIPVLLASGRVVFWCTEYSHIWCELPISSDTISGSDNDTFWCGELAVLGQARLGLAQDLVLPESTEPQWQIVSGERVPALAFPDDFVVDHSGYVLSVGDCPECDCDRVLAWVTVSGQLVFRCPNGHEKLTDSDGAVFPLWRLPDDESGSVGVERLAHAGDVAAIHRELGYRSPDDKELWLSDLLWAILPRA